MADNNSIKTYRMLQSASGLKVGDKVRIMRRARDYEKGWNNTWVSPEMDWDIGKIGTVKSMTSDGVEFVEFLCRYPVFVLEKVE